MTATRLVDEGGRLDAVRRYDILDTPPDGAFDRITALASRLFDVPISIVSIVDTDRIWFKSHHGLEVDQIDREPGLCASAILHDEPWLVSDAVNDPRTLANPLVAGEFGLRFYAGVPLTTHDGFNLGTLCVIDREPREVSDSDMSMLSDLGAVVMDEIEMRLAARRAFALETQLREQAESVARSLQETLLPAQLPSIEGVDLAARYHVAERDVVGGDFYDVIPTPAGCVVVVGDACGKGSRAAALTGAARWSLRALVSEKSPGPAFALKQLNDVLAKVHDVPDTYCTVALATVERHPGGGLDVAVALGGHPFCLVQRGDGTVEQFGSAAPIVGWFADAQFKEARTTLAPGDAMVIFTDGLLEALSPHGDSDDTAVRELLGSRTSKSADELADLLDTVLASETLGDDAAFLVVRAQ